jgi:hypothetical protein
MGIIEGWKNFKLNIDMEGMIATTTKGLLWEFTDVFAWNYNLKESHLTLRITKLNLTLPIPLHTKHTSTRIQTIQQSSNKTLIGFIKPVEHKFGWITFNLAKFG